MIRYFPVFATVLIEAAGVGQMIRMIQVSSSEGQNPFSYLLIIAALVLWERFYAIQTPNEKPAIWTARASILINILVLATVVYFTP